MQKANEPDGRKGKTAVGKPSAVIARRSAHLKRKHVREMDITGRSMKGWLLVDPPAIATAGGLQRWIETSRRFVATLPRK